MRAAATGDNFYPRSDAKRAAEKVKANAGKTSIG
jgi:hypothetical protein